MTVASYLQELKQGIDEIDIKQVDNLIRLLENAHDRGANIFIIGNGGSASTASHMANDLISLGFSAQALTDSAVLTCIANDFGYDEIFRKQLKALLRPCDLLIAISASGNSPNVIKAVEWANGNEATTVCLVGFDGGELIKRAHHAVHVKTPYGKYGIVEDIHLAVNHVVTAILRLRIT